MRKELIAVTLAGTLLMGGCAAETAAPSAEAPAESATAESSAAVETTSEPTEQESESFDPESAFKSDDSAIDTTSDSKPATNITAERNQQVYDYLDFSDTTENEYAVKGLIESPEALEIKDADGNVVWSQKAYAFLDEKDMAPDSANPSLWQNAINNHVYGLFKVTDGIYQVRGYDMANITFIEGETGWIIFDTSMGKEVAQASLELVEKNLGEKPIKAVLISHPHADHFGGIEAFVTKDTIADKTKSIKDQIESDKIPVIVPEGFTEHAVAENLYAGTAMSRRARYQYGVHLDKSPTGSLSMGIGMGQSTGTLTFLEPSYEVKKTGEKMTIDGVEIEFQMTPGTEAPAEMNAYFPQKKALWLAENCTTTLHNLYTLRGAEVRDGNAWAEYIMEAVALYGDETEVSFQSHNWPHWGREVIKDYMINTAAVYKYINDETLTQLNLGKTSTEIANTIALPDVLAKNWYTRQYYGTVAHDSKAVYQKYMGWYDANPINLAKLTPEESAKKWVEYLDLGGVNEAMKKAQEEYDEGHYQWVAEFTNMMVFADPTNQDARNLCADAMEQLGYQAESGTWRNCYLTAALELRNGNQSAELSRNNNGTASLMEHLTPEMTFEYMGILLNKEEMANESFNIQFELTDADETYTLCMRYGALLYVKGTLGDEPVATVRCPQKALLTMTSGNSDTLKGYADISGDEAKLDELISALNMFSGGARGDFNIVEP